MQNEMQSITPLSILSLLDTDKSQRSSFVMGILEAIDNGKADPLKVHGQVKKIEEIISMLTDRKKYPVTAQAYSNYVLEAAEKQDKTGKQFEMFDAKWQIKEVGTKYDYSQCNDPVHAELTKALEEAKENLAKRETMLKTLPTKGLIITDEDTGEVHELFPPSRTSTTSVSLTLL